MSRKGVLNLCLTWRRMMLYFWLSARMLRVQSMEYNMPLTLSNSWLHGTYTPSVLYMATKCTRIVWNTYLLDLIVKVNLECSLTSGAWMVESLSSPLTYLLPICMKQSQWMNTLQEEAVLYLCCFDGFTVNIWSD